MSPGGGRARQRALWLGLALITLGLLGVGNAVVWGPLWWHFRVDVKPASEDIIRQHRQLPGDDVLSVVAGAAMMTDHPLRGEAAVQAARRILAGELALPALPVLPLEPGFVPAQLERGVPVQQVFIASLIVPDLLLRAHEHTPDPVFLKAAQDYVRAFAEHEAGAAFAEGLLFNSHAVANRAAVLARLWLKVRSTADEPLAQAMHLLARRSGAMLSKPGHYIAATNHGVMQSVALLQLAAAFPKMPEVPQWESLAMDRLTIQLPVYIGSDGGVLEHSAGYHFHGVVLTGYIVRLLEATGKPVPPAWRQAHLAAREVLAALQRPDASLPAIGNTYRYQWRLPALVQPDAGAWEQALQGRPSFARTFPVTGIGVWWDGAAGVQSVMPWGWFPGHGHARAQELSLLIWSRGVDWSTNTGYWPNSDGVGYETANGWDGGNGPHVIGEPWQGPRRSHVRGQLEQGDWRVIDLERVVDEQLRVRRQVLHWKSQLWLVLDSYVDAKMRPLRVLWTAAPETQLATAGDRAFAWRRDGAELRFAASIDGSAGVTATPLRGSRDPFGGWVAFDRRAAPAPAVDARLPSPRGWMLATLELAPADSPAGVRARMQRYEGPEDWSLAWPTPGGDLTLTRRGSTLTVTDPSQSPPERSMKLQAGPAADAELAAIQTQGDALRQRYPRYRTAEDVRRERSMLLTLAWGLACGALWIWARRKRTRGPAA